MFWGEKKIFLFHFHFINENISLLLTKIFFGKKFKINKKIRYLFGEFLIFLFFETEKERRKREREREGFLFWEREGGKRRWLSIGFFLSFFSLFKSFLFCVFFLFEI